MGRRTESVNVGADGGFDRHPASWKHHGLGRQGKEGRDVRLDDLDLLCGAAFPPH
jgi:hypothetical protein